MKTISSRQFNRNTSGAKKAAEHGPVFITDRGRASHVLLRIEDYQRLVGREMSLLQAVAQTDPSEAELDPPRLDGPIHRPAKLG